jgi:dynein assembly factor 1
MEMTEQLLRQLCVKNKGYRTPSLNDQLYLHFNGFTHLANLDAYTGTKSMYLESNALSSFEGLPRLEQLMCL